ncbi:rhamnogalacturonan acetylesterase [Chryseobacterium terrae]|uniref:Rhamnogalacturonan acetylesterase n=1 Tax=Chryseobacterium terrae TaxID=3163299 RepID=A0ABW8Y0H9_9FLAO
MRRRTYKITSIIVSALLLAGCQTRATVENSPRKVDQEITHIYLIGDSTVADYTGDYDKGKDYMKARYPLAGWGQMFQSFFVRDQLADLQPGITTDSVQVLDKARGGRSTRTFFQEGRWREVYENIQPGDYVLMQFGHNDGSEKHPDRFVTVQGYKEFLRLFINQTREKGGIPIILSPVARNFPWKDGKLQNVHGAYWQAPLQIAREMNAQFIDLNKISLDYFNEKGREFVTENYFNHLQAG